MKDVFKEIKDYFKRTAEDVLQKELDANPYYPFKVIQSQALQFSVRYTALFISLAGFVLSCGMIIFWIAQGLVRNAFFILPFLVMVVSLSGIWNYKDTRYYTLLPSQKEYMFAHNQKVHVRGEFYNIYIRLRREVRSGQAKYYHLVLNGYQIDSRRLSGTSKNVDRLRKLGQTMAANLNLNYFDEANTSQHHVIRHFRSDKQVFSFRKGSVAAGKSFSQ